MKKYLNEEQYQATKKKLIKIANIVLVVGLLLAVTLLVCGIVKKSNTDDTSKYNAQIETLQQEISALNEQISNEFMDNGLSSQYYTLSNQRSTKQKQMINLEQKVWEIENDRSYIGLWTGSSLVFFLTAGAVATLYVYAYRRNIMAYGKQSTMPIAQESLETMAPTIGKVSEEITKGILKGKSENEK